ncbi:MAG: hypothetical protein HPY50_18270 [Firmicutes bacterium]|nr:hypothetical protein [Bacillota bacterium]
MRTLNFKKILLGSLLGLVLLAAVLGGAWRYTGFGRPLKVSQEYVGALVAGDKETAQSTSTGQAAVVASMIAGSGGPKVNSMKAYIEGLGKNWARIKVQVEPQLPDGSLELVWYSLDTLKTDEGWKVALISEATPTLEGASLYYPKGEVPQLEQVFKGFAAAMGEGDYPEAIKYLTGPVLSQDLSSAGPLFKEIGQIELQPLWDKGGIVASRVRFTVSSGEQMLLVSFARLSSGDWKIISIS